MRIEQLYYLMEVVRANSISRAAEKIFVTQQTISHSLGNLEQELGVKLLVRTRKGIFLTDEGKIFYEQACKVLKSFGELKTSCCFDNNQLNKIDEEINGSMMLYCSSILATSCVKQIVNDFSDKYQNLHIQLYEKNNLSIFPIVAKQVESIAVISVAAEHFARSLKEEYKHELWYETLCLDELLVCVSKKSPLAKKSNISVKELLHYPLAMSLNSVSDFSNLQIAAHEKVEAANVVLVTADNQWIKQVVSANRAVSFASLRMIQTKLWMGDFGQENDVVFIPFKENLHLAYMVIKSQKHENTPIDNLFLQELRHYFARL